MKAKLTVELEVDLLVDESQDPKLEAEIALRSAVCGALKGLKDDRNAKVIDSTATWSETIKLKRGEIQ